MNCFICPICGARLSKSDKSYICQSRHCFDIAREGYVNLLSAGKANSAVPGDNKDMVNARTRFLESGGYAVFADKIADIVSHLSSKKAPIILDAGCGQGYYDRKIKDKLPESELFGIDISKFAVKYASSHNKDISYAVAGVYDMPIADGCADILLSVFSPLAPQEFARVAADEAALVIAVPGPRHLFGLKEILYREPYENEIISTEYEGFEFAERVPIKASLSLEGNELITALFAMTPYYWKTGTDGHERLKNTAALETEIEFDILVYRRIKHNK